MPSSSEQDPSNRTQLDKATFGGLQIDGNGRAKYLEDGSFSTPSNHLLSHPRKSKSVANNLMYANGGLHDPLISPESEENDVDRWIEKLLVKCEKSEADNVTSPPVNVLEEENSSSRLVVPFQEDAWLSGPMHLPELDWTLIQSSITSSLQDPDSGALSSLWPTSMWRLKQDFQALSSAAIPIFDGLPKPMDRKNKAALDYQDGLDFNKYRLLDGVEIGSLEAGKKRQCSALLLKNCFSMHSCFIQLGR
ncbi:hypothetical protein OROGR_021394 [Orobanche gracilis]